MTESHSAIINLMRYLRSMNEKQSDKVRTRVETAGARWDKTVESRWLCFGALSRFRGFSAAQLESRAA